MKREPNTEIVENTAVPVDLWDRDHWSTLAYIETKLVDGGSYSVRFDASMRQKRRHFRLLADALPRNKKHLVQRAVVMDDEYGTRLEDGTYLPWHDDWDCVADMIEAGLFVDSQEELIGHPLVLTTRGLMACNAIRNHKAKGGSFANCGVAARQAITRAKE